MRGSRSNPLWEREPGLRSDYEAMNGHTQWHYISHIAYLESRHPALMGGRDFAYDSNVTASEAKQSHVLWGLLRREEQPPRNDK